MGAKTETTVEVIGQRSEPEFDLIFVHGLTGSSTDTWTADLGDSEDGFWPNWMCGDFPKAAVHLVDYPSPIFKKWTGKELDLHAQADNILENLVCDGVGQRPVVFIAHSLGGILVKEILRAAAESLDSDWQSVASNTRLSCFVSTPHTGASLADVVKSLAPRLTSKQLDVIANDSGYLNDLKDSYRAISESRNIATAAYFETHKTNGAFLVVTSESADPGVTKCKPIAIESDHVAIAKPRSKNSLIYRSISKHVEKVSKTVEEGTSCPSPFSVEDYSRESLEDRRDLLQKLIDANREEEYKLANELQSRFALKYHQLGLLTKAKEDSDVILADVEQRFNTHVYQEKICRDADDAEIAIALQTQVVDAVCAKFGDTQPVTASNVLQALYFLTQRCHIRWDKR